MIPAIEKIPAIYTQQYPKFVYPTPPARKCRKCGKGHHKLTNSLCNQCLDRAWADFVEVVMQEVYVRDKWQWEV